jgi:hypothetical protein
MSGGCLITGEVIVRSFFSDDMSDMKCKGKPLPVAISEMASMVVAQMRDPKVLLRRIILRSHWKKLYFQSDRDIVERIELFRELAKSRIEARLQDPEALEKKNDFLSIYLR